jgi:enamine deaminase RidA (YjgF/YER057c/UK114 family)
MKSRKQQVVQPLGWARPRGFSNGIIAEGRMLFIAGQVGWDPRSATPKFPKTFSEQFDQALANVIEVLREAGGRPEDMVRLTLYVVDKDEYLESVAAVGAAWRRRMGRHYPAMTLVEVASLLEDSARVELEATAVI